jgi:hypothetical protein
MKQEARHSPLFLMDTHPPSVSYSVHACSLSGISLLSCTYFGTLLGVLSSWEPGASGS